MPQQILCQQSMCQHVLIKQTLSINSVNKFCAQNMSTNYASTNYVKKLCDRIMSTNSESTNSMSMDYVNNFPVNKLGHRIISPNYVSTNYVKKLCREFLPMQPNEIQLHCQTYILERAVLGLCDCNMCIL